VKLATLSRDSVRSELKRGGVRLRIGPFAVSIHADDADFASTLHFLYQDFPLLREDELSEFRVRVEYPHGLRRWWRRQVRFYLDDIEPFEPFPSRLATPFFEWGLNWCIYEHANEFLIIHSAVVERDGRAVVMPALPGSGKSTLCAALVLGGWRLLSDEFALIGAADGRMLPIPRPIGLKEKSIGIIRALRGAVELGPTFVDTRKGDVAHLRPPSESVRRADEPATVGWMIFPRYQAGAQNRLEPLSKASGFAKASDDSFNYEMLGATGFEFLSAVIDRCECFDLTFSDLQAGIDLIEAAVGGS
jgi:HprK-related kinase A